MAQRHVRSLHFDFSHLEPSNEYTFHESLQSVLLTRHSDQSRAAARARLPLLKVIPDHHLTHFVEVELPSDTIVLTYVTIPKPRAGSSIAHPVHMAVHIPDAGHEIARAARRARDPDATSSRVHPKLARLGITARALQEQVGVDAYPPWPEHIHVYQDATDAAVALLYHHTNVVNLDASDGGSIPAIIVAHLLDAISATGDLPLSILTLRDAWLVSTPVGNTHSLSPDPSVSFAGALQKALLKLRTDTALQGKQWNSHHGVSSLDVTGPSAGVGAQRAGAATGPGTDTWVARWLTATDGLSVDTDSIQYTPPATTTTWSAANVWSLADTPSLTSNIADALKSGAVYAQIVTNAHPEGLLRGQLVPQEADDGAAIAFTVTFDGTSVVPPVTTSASATGTFSLNSGRTGLTYTLSVQGLDAAATAGAALYLGKPGERAASPVHDMAITNAAGTGTLTFNCKNNYLRHLSACVQYLDVGGNVLAPQGMSDRVPRFLRTVFEPDSNKPFVDLIPPVTTIFGVPIPPDSTTISVPIWEDVHTVRILYGGFGRGTYDSAVCPIGLTVTALAEMALPVFLLLVGTAVTNSKFVKSLMADKEVLFAVCAAGGFLAAGAGAADIGLAQDPASAAKGLAEKFGPMLLSPATSLGLYVLQQVDEGAVERAVPFVDIALAVLNGAVTAAELAQTFIEVLDSPFVYEVDLTRSMTLVVTLVPDSRFNKFPDPHATLRVQVTYDTATTTLQQELTFPSTPLSDPITVRFPSVPAGGNLRVDAFFYATNGWQSGQGNSGWLPAAADGTGSGTMTIGQLEVTTNQIPLGISSVYQHAFKLGCDPSTRDLSWLSAPGQPPVTTLTTASRSFVHWRSITFAQEPEMLGYSWQATGMNLPPDGPSAPPTADLQWTIANVSVLQSPGAGYARPTISFTQEPGLAYNLASPDNSPTNFYIDSSNPHFDAAQNPSGGWHVRSIILTHDEQPSFTPSNNLSYGRFPQQMDRYAAHPQGYMFGINLGTHKLYRVKLLDAAGPDEAAPMAFMSSGEGALDGLMSLPVSVAIALDGRVLVLESGNQRVQAFNFDGIPVPSFKAAGAGSTGPSGAALRSTMALFARPGSTYLDLSVESSGYVFVLSYTGDGSDPSMYQVDLYDPDGAYLATTPDVAAASIVVDILRNLWTLNYETFVLGRDGSTQPSVSNWQPPPPPPEVA